MEQWIIVNTFGIALYLNMNRIVICLCLLLLIRIIFMIKGLCIFIQLMLSEIRKMNLWMRRQFPYQPVGKFVSLHLAANILLITSGRQHSLLIHDLLEEFKSLVILGLCVWIVLHASLTLCNSWYVKDDFKLLEPILSYASSSMATLDTLSLKLHYNAYWCSSDLVTYLNFLDF